jgi:short-subunit dehydrogenase
LNKHARLAVVTGGTKGIGRAIIESLSSVGLNIATCARNPSDLAALKQATESRHGNTVHTQVADMSKKAQVQAFAEFVRNTGLECDVLVNNAGVFAIGATHEEPDGILENLIDTNLYSAYYLARALIPAMKLRRRGHIFNIASIASFMAYPNGGSYAISKHAMHGMSKVLRAELKEFGIKVTSVMPGATLTASWEGVDLPEERFIPAEDVAKLVLAIYQLSDRSVVEELVIRPQLGDL